MGVISKVKTWQDNENVTYTDLNGNFNNIYNEFNGSITNDNIATAAAIDAAKIAGTAATLNSTQTFTSVKTFDLEQTLKEISTPASPPTSGYRKVYMKSDGNFYTLNASSIESFVGQGLDGWISPNETWVYAGTNSFTIAGVDRTARYRKGTKIKMTIAGVTRYFYVTTTPVFSINTTVVVSGGSDFVIANDTISANYYSYEAAPQGFPTWFNFTVPVFGYSTDADIKGLFKIDGNFATALYWKGAGSAGVSNATSLAYGLPVSAATLTGFLNFVAGRSVNNGVEGIGIAQIASAGSSFLVNPGAGGTTWTGSGPKYWEGQVSYPI